MADALDCDDIVIKYDQVYIPNAEVCPGKKFPSFLAMKEAVGAELDAAEAYADAHDIPFNPYKVEYVLKPEFENEKPEVGIFSDSDSDA